MSTILIIAIGSQGDVAPLVGAGVRLQLAGHDVSIAAYRRFAPLISKAGLTFRALAEPGDGAETADINVTKELAAFLAPSGMRAQGEALLETLLDVPADIVLLSPFAELAGHPLAEAKGIPSVGMRLQPLSATASYPPTFLGGWTAGSAGNRLAARGGAWAIDRVYGSVIAGFRRDLGLPRASATALRRRRTEANWPVLHGYSPTVAPRPKDWREGLDVVGHWWPPVEPHWRPPQVLTDFLAAGAAPVYVGLGSTMASPRRIEELAEIIPAALCKANVRGIVQSGWAGIEITGDDILTIDETPHEWLFPRMAAVAHHCGAGTTAAGLRAAVPTIALPGLGDQPFWARRLRDLGVSATTIPQRRLTEERLAQAIRVAVSDDTLGAECRRLAGAIATEDGAARVVDVVGSLVGA